MAESSALQQNKRTAWIDIAKAVAMFCIVFGHVSIGQYGQCFVYSFHIPVFIFLSGFCFSEGKNFGDFIKKKALRILVPYFTFGIVEAAIYIIFCKYFYSGVSYSVTDCIIGLLIGNAKSNKMGFNLHLWFLPFLFSISLMFYLFKKISDFITDKIGAKRIYGYAVLFVISVVVSVVFLDHKIYNYLPFGIEIAVRDMPYFALGFLTKSFGKINGDIDRKNKKQLLIAAAVFAVSLAVLIFFADKNIWHNPEKKFMVNYYREFYGVPLYYFAAAFAGIIAVISLSKILPAFKWLTYFGRNTIAVLVMQKLFIMPLRTLRGKLPLAIRHSLIVYLALAAAAAAMCLAADLIIKKLLPFMYGRWYEKKKKSEVKNEA